MSKPTVLVVEDETITAMALCATLETMGYAVPATVPTGEEAIERARALRPDVVLMDIRLKGAIDGITAAETIRREVGAPVVYLTAYSDPETLRRARVTEPYGYIVKPYNESELRAVVEIAVHKGQMERARAAETELVSPTVFQNIIDVNPGAVYLKRADGRILFVNRRFESLFGLSREGARDVSDAALLPQDLAEGDARALRENRITHARETVRVPGGQRTFLAVRLPLQRTDGSTYGLCTILTELDRPDDAIGLLGRELQRAAGEPPTTAADALIGAHEALSQEARAVTSSVRSLLARMLAPAKDAPSPPPSARDTVDVSALARQVMTRLVDEREMKRIDFVVEPGLTASADRVLLRVVLEGLLDNAIKFTARRPRAKIEVGARAGPGEQRTFYVRDNGIGFEGDAAASLFQPFARLHAADGYPGIGLGLSAVREYVTAHGGRVWAEGRTDAGATFYFSLPTG